MQSVKPTINKVFMKLYDNNYKRIYNYIYKSVLNKETAEDITSTTFLKALSYIKKNNTIITYEYTWLYKIATNEILMYVRKNKKVHFSNHDEVIQELERTQKDSNVIDRYMDYVAIKAQIKQLKPAEAQIITMHFFENLSYEEMSNILNIKETTLRSRVHRILAKLKKILNHDQMVEPREESFTPQLAFAA